jgi:hypothetical protein
MPREATNTARRRLPTLLKYIFISESYSWQT